MKARLAVLAAAGTLLTAAGTATTAHPAVAAAPAPVVRVMPLGDSITFGVKSCTGAGYRLPLQSMVETEGRYHVDFVGSQQAGHMADPQNEGHPGWEISQISAQVDGWLADAHPDVVLLHIGINDLANGDHPDQAADRATQLINQIFTDRPGVTLIMQGLIPTTVGWSSSPSTLPALISNYNSQLRQLEATEQQQGRHFRFVDAPALTPASQVDAAHPLQLADGVHPNDAGYRLFAQNFRTPLDQTYGAGWFSGTAGQPDPATEPNTVHLVTIAPDGGLNNVEGDYTAWSWSTWNSMGQGGIAEVSAAATGTTNHVFAITAGKQLLEKDGNYGTGQWSGWFQPAIGVLPNTVPVAVSASSYDNVVHLVVVGQDGHLYNSDGDYAAGAWNGWTDHGGNFSRVASATTADSVNHVFAIEKNTNLVKELDGDYCAKRWSDWAVAGSSAFTAGDVAASASADTVHLSAIGLDGSWSNTDGDFDAGSWNGWAPMGGSGLARIATAAANNVNHVFVTTTDNHLQETDGDYTAGTWSAWGAPTNAGNAIGVTAAFTH
jgi:lysophospholipase L1-like esterase